MDSASTRPKRGEKTGPNPVDRGRPGSKRHLLVDGNGTPLLAVLTGAQVHDSMIFEELVDGVEPIKGPKGRPRKRPEKLHADKDYDYQRCRRFLMRRGIGAHFKTGSIKQPEARSVLVGCGTDAGLAILLPAAVRPLQTESRYPRCLPRTGLRPRVLQSLAKRVMKPFHRARRTPPRHDVAGRIIVDVRPHLDPQREASACTLNLMPKPTRGSLFTKPAVGDGRPPGP